ncbi:MAG: LacI family transcriptional regulator [Propionibacteriaceae bacterium]|nr:LacI family transcriptional regulator [Propionibacteriaceae bacterium]
MTTPTLDEVARLAGVSRSTASRVLNGGVASPRAAAAVRAAIATLGFVPNRAARDLARMRTDAIALVAPDSPDNIFSSVFMSIAARSISQEFWRAGLQPMLVLMDPADPGPTAGRFLRSGNVDGLVVMNYHENPAVEDLLRDSGLPTVFVGRPPRPGLYPYVDADNRHGAGLATRRLIEQGRRHVACLGGPLAMTAAQDRRDGWLDAHAELGQEPGPYVEGEFRTESGRAGVEWLLEHAPATDGVFAHADSIAAGAIQGLRAAGRSVPGDVALVGFDDFPTAVETCPTLTTVAQPVAALARTAGRLLIDYLRDGVWPDQPIVFPTELVVRDSG